MALDLGCGWLHSGERNPWTAIAEASGFTVDRSESAWRDQYRDLGFSKTEQRDAAAAWQAFQDRLRHDPPASDRAADALDPDGPWNGHAEALSGYINGAGLARLSIADYRAYDEAASETNWRVREGYGTLVAASLPPVPLHLATPVTAIDHRGTRVRLDTRAGTIAARAAIVTVSTAMLAAGAIALPHRPSTTISTPPPACRWGSPTSCSSRWPAATASNPKRICSATRAAPRRAAIISCLSVAR